MLEEFRTWLWNVWKIGIKFDRVFRRIAHSIDSVVVRRCIILEYFQVHSRGWIIVNTAWETGLLNYRHLCVFTSSDVQPWYLDPVSACSLLITVDQIDCWHFQLVRLVSFKLNIDVRSYLSFKELHIDFGAWQHVCPETWAPKLIITNNLPSTYSKLPLNYARATNKRCQVTSRSLSASVSTLGTWCAVICCLYLHSGWSPLAGFRSRL